MSDNETPAAEVFVTDVACMTACTHGRKPFRATIGKGAIFIAAKDIHAARMAYLHKQGVAIKQMTLGETNAAFARSNAALRAELDAKAK